MSAGCRTSWADTLSGQERRIVAAKLARACKSFFAATLVPGKSRTSLAAFSLASAEMSELHLDVTERAS